MARRADAEGAWAEQEVRAAGRRTIDTTFAPDRAPSTPARDAVRVRKYRAVFSRTTSV